MKGVFIPPHLEDDEARGGHLNAGTMILIINRSTRWRQSGEGDRSNETNHLVQKERHATG